MRPALRTGAAAVAVLVAAALPAGAQQPTTTGPATTRPAAGAQGPVAAPGSDQPPGRPRVVDLTPRVVDLSVRVASTDDAQLSIETPEARSVTLASDVLFETDRSDLDADARARVDAIADELTELGGPRTITIEGHTDDVGTPEDNQGLSERRAFAVASRLEAQLNDDAFTIEHTGYGETRPVASNGNEEGRALNRRVVIAYPTD
jgi:outer membrane protein OmpA-like peptidoglycan-associated protein